MKLNMTTINSLFFVLAIIFSGTVELRMITAFPISQTVALIMLLIACLTGICIECDVLITKTMLTVFFAITVYLLFFAAIKRYMVQSYLTTYVVYILLFFVYSYILLKKEKFMVLLDVYEKVFLLISVLSLFFWLFGSVLNIIPGRTSVEYLFSGKIRHSFTYFFLYFENFDQNTDQLLGARFPRNCGIYCEAPAYSGMLLYAFGIELFAQKKVSRLRIAILIITMLTTQSSKAYIIVAIILMLRYLFGSEEESLRTRLQRMNKFIISGAIIVVVVLAIWYVYHLKSTGNSFNARRIYLISALRAWQQHPIFGTGFRNRDSIVSIQTSELGVTTGGLSMGWAILLAEGGLYLFAFYIFAFLYARRYPQIEKNNKKYNLFAIMCFINLFISYSIYTYAVLFMLGAAYAAGALGTEYNKKRLVKRTMAVNSQGIRKKYYRYYRM